jgi:hypothetical protein
MFTGRRYHTTKHLGLPEIAQQMRADIAQLKTDNLLPAHAAVSVRIDQKGTGSGSINITVTGMHDAEIWHTPGVTDMHTRDGHWGGLTPLGRQVTDALEDIHHAYNYDRSDTMTDYFDVRYYGGVSILNEQTQRRVSEQKARQQKREAANRAARHAAQALPLRATITGDRAARLVITDTRTGHEVATVDTKRYSREFLTASFVEHLLAACGWDVARYHRRSKTNPIGYWSVRRADAADPIVPTNPIEPTDTDPTPNAEIVPPVPAPTPAEDGQAINDDHEDQHAVGPVELDPINWVDLDFDHWAARWTRATETMPADDPARIWSRATATLIAAGYRYERHEAPGTVDHTARLVTTDARDNVTDEAAALAQRAAAIVDHVTAEIRATYPHARPIVLDGTGLSGTRCETRCGALSRWSVPNPSTNDRTPSRLAYCPACLLAHAHPTAPAEGPAELEQFGGATILHTAETGTLLLDTTEGDGSYDILTGAGQRWRGLRHGDYAGALFLPHTRDRAANRYTINHTAELLRAAGWTVRVHIDDTPRDPAHVAADRRERSAERADRLRARAGRRQAASDAAYDRASQISERFAAGQPILIGHHGEARARRDRDRVHAAMDRSCALRGEAQRYQAAAEAADHNATRQDSPQLIARRIKRHTAEEARIQRSLTGYQRRFRSRDGYQVEDHPAATGVHREQLLAELQHVRAALAADEQALADLAADGTWRPIDPATIKPGDAIRARGRWEKVVRVNRTTVSVATGYDWTDRVPFTEITRHRPAATAH